MATPAAYIAFDYDGYDQEHRWDLDCTVTIGNASDPNNVLHGNTPARRVWETTGCRADMNNDGDVGFPDTNPFVLALSDADAYATAFPGLGGSMVFHADCNCDGQLNLQDINPFVAIVTSGICDPDCFSEDSVPDAPPAALAAALDSSIRSDLRAALLEWIGAYVECETRPEFRAYWQAVHMALTE